MLHRSKSCQKVAQQLVAESNWGRSRGFRKAQNKTSSETHARGRLAGEQRVHRLENPPELFQYCLLSFRLNSFLALTLHSTITNPNCHSYFFFPKHSGSNPFLYCHVGRGSCSCPFVLFVSVCLYSVHLICKSVIPISTSKTSEQG